MIHAILYIRLKHTIYDVISASGELIGTYCNGADLNDLVSDSTSMYVVFDSDGSSTSGGFRIYYKEVSGECVHEGESKTSYPTRGSRI